MRSTPRQGRGFAAGERLDMNITLGSKLVCMSMESVAWSTLYQGNRSLDAPTRSPRETLRRMGPFARPHRWRLTWFLLLSVLSALLAVATPLLAGKVVDRIVGGGPTSTVVELALLIAAIALAGAGVDLLSRWFSSRIGEGLIYQLRTAVFDHVQTMPVAFFTRTRTGALVSRLNNDVLGAQRAFSDTLAGVVTNVVTLALTLGVMLSISWQITLLALVLLPVFIIPSRSMGRKIAAMSRRAARHNASMSDQMTERFSAPGATLVKLYGRPEIESHEFAWRAGAVRDIGVRTAMARMTFVTMLTLVSSLALALVYGLGGFYAIRGDLQAGAVVALALLLTRLYVPLTALANARVEVMTALVSFERVFEVLDLEPMVRDAPDARAIAKGPTELRFDGVDFAYPSAEKVSLASLEEVAHLDTRGGETVLHASISPRRRARWWRWSEVPAPASRRSRSSPPASTTPTRVRSPSTASTCVRSPPGACIPPSAWSRRTGTCSTTPSARTCCSRIRRRPMPRSATRCDGPASRNWWPTCPTGWTPSSASAATGSRAASANA